MKSLRFKIERGYNVQNIVSVPINEDSVKEEQEKWNTKYSAIIDKLNDSSDEGHVAIVVSHSTGLVQSSIPRYTPEGLDILQELD